jgi:phosphatidylserine decarboxylase
MSEFEPVQYRSFAEFFDRRFRPGARKFPPAPKQMGAFAEARYLAWHTLAADQQFPIKGHSLSAEHILGNAEPRSAVHWRSRFLGAASARRLSPSALLR